jgi:hypothetical protein
VCIVLSQFLAVAIVDVVRAMLDGFLFDVAAFPKLHIVSILFFWTDGQEGIEFLELPGNAWAGLLFMSHIVVSNKVAVSAQDDGCISVFLS